ncbi:MAG: dihydrofolate reductase family protein [Conexibacteraceae bacterium]|nr:dihydrofolate reductase family protein [Conexibacteraceae bacterium]
MAKVFTALAVSADGYIAGPNDGPGNPLGDGGARLFKWYRDGDTQSRYYPQFRLSEKSASVFDAICARTGAVLSGRRTYEIANAWGGRGPLPGVPLFVLTHEPPQPPPASDPPYTFVQHGIADAVERAKHTAAKREADVALMGSAPVRQALAHDLLDEITLHQVPILLGGGVRLLDHFPTEVSLNRVVYAPGVIHIAYELVR